MNNIQSEILNDLKSAKQSIKVAVSWLTDVALINELQYACDRGVIIQVVLSNNELNILRFELFQKLLNHGADVRKWGNELPEQGEFMHYKFYIIDDKFAKSGSYNWSVNALTNKEALDEVSVSKKKIEFEKCFNQGVNFFKNIDNPKKKRDELQSIQNSQTEILTPEKLIAYRQTQIAIEAQEKRHKAELEEKERQRLAEEEARHKAEEKAAREIEEYKKRLNEKEPQEGQGKYTPKEDVKIAQVPPTSYGL